MIAFATGQWLVWGSPLAEDRWERYHPPHDGLRDALREARALQRARPDRVYVVLPEGRRPDE